MSNGNGSLIHAIRGPIMLITIGALFALSNFTPYGFAQTWPVILIVFGVLTLLGRATASPTPEPPPQYPYQQQAGGYRQSTYSQPGQTGPTPPAGGAL